MDKSNHWVEKRWNQISKNGKKIKTKRTVPPKSKRGKRVETLIKRWKTWQQQFHQQKEGGTQSQSNKFAFRQRFEKLASIPSKKAKL